MRKILAYMVIAAVSCSAGMIFLEMALRTFLPVYFTGYVGAYVYDEKLGARLKPNIHFFKTTDYQQEVFTNEIGTVNFQESFDEYDILVFAIGDSFTQGTGLPGDATYPFQLDMILNMQKGEYTRKYAVINLGLAAFGAKQAYLSLLMYREILGNPDYILFLGCGNDYDDDVLFSQGYRHKHLVEGNPRWGLFNKPCRWFTNETEIGKRLKLFVLKFRKKSYLKDDSKYKKGQTKKKRIVAQLQEPELVKLLSFSGELGAKLIVSWADFPGETFSSYAWLKEWTKENNVAFADWAPKANSVKNAIPGLPINNQHSGGHYRTWVNNMIAKAFAEQIQK